MKKFAKRQMRHHQNFMLFHSLRFLARFSNPEMLSWPNSPLLVMLQFVDPSVLFGDEKKSFTPLHVLVELVDPFEYSTHENQLVLAKQLIEHDANVNAVSNPKGKTPLHYACFWCNVTNLDFIGLLLEAGANLNAQDHMGVTPLMCTTPAAPGAAKFLLNWPTTDVDVTDQFGESFPVMVRKAVKSISSKSALPEDPLQIQHQFMLQQWTEIEDMLVERGAADTGITTLE